MIRRILLGLAAALSLAGAALAQSSSFDRDLLGRIQGQDLPAARNTLAKLSKALDAEAARAQSAEAALDNGVPLGTPLGLSNGGTNATTAAAARVNLGLEIGADVQAHDPDLDNIAALATSAWGRSLLTQADAAALRTYAGLAIGTDVQAEDSDLDAIALLSTTTFGRSLLTLADAAGLRSAGGLVIGTNVQAWSNVLDAYAAADWSAGVQVPALTGAHTLTLKTVGSASGNLLDKAAGDGLYQPLDSDLTAIALLSTTTFGRNLLALADAAALRTAAGVTAMSTAAASADVAAALSDETGTGHVVFDTSPTLTTPNIGAATGVSLALTGGTITAASPIFDLTRTWNNSGVAFTGIRFNVTDTASSASSLLVDLQKGGASQFSVTKSGAGVFAGAVSTVGGIGSNGGAPASQGLTFSGSTTGVVAGSGGTLTLGDATRASRYAQLTPGVAQLGGADAASPVAQKLAAQGVVSGTTDTAGAAFTIAGSAGTGTGNGGDINLAVAKPAGSTGSSQNSTANVVVISGQTGRVTVNPGTNAGGSNIPLSLQNSSSTASTEVCFDLNPSTNAAGVRSGQACAVNDGTNAISVRLKVSLGGVPTTILTLNAKGSVNYTPMASDPTSPAEGDCYWNSGVHKLKCYDGTTWQALW